MLQRTQAIIALKNNSGRADKGSTIVIPNQHTCHLLWCSFFSFCCVLWHSAFFSFPHLWFSFFFLGPLHCWGSWLLRPFFFFCSRMCATLLCQFLRWGWGLHISLFCLGAANGVCWVSSAFNLLQALLRQECWPAHQIFAVWGCWGYCFVLPPRT